MTHALSLARRCARWHPSCVLLTGESGTGKEVVASFIHASSERASGPLVTLNIAAISPSMLEAELFGSVRGAYTGSSEDRLGFFGAAHGGTLLLDEIGELPIDMQAKLLRVLETRRYFPVGSRAEVTCDVLVVAATNRDPASEVACGRLRADLYYRLAAIEIALPPLRERVEDIEPIVHALLASVRKRIGRGPARFDDEAMGVLLAHSWPGNVRELRNVVERAALLIDDEVVTRGPLLDVAFAHPSSRSMPLEPIAHDEPPYDPRTLEEVVESSIAAIERRHIRATLAHVAGNRERAARILGVARSTLWKRMRKYGLEP